MHSFSNSKRIDDPTNPQKEELSTTLFEKGGPCAFKKHISSLTQQRSKSFVSLKHEVQTAKLFTFKPQIHQFIVEGNVLKESPNSREHHFEILAEDNRFRNWLRGIAKVVKEQKDFQECQNRIEFTDTQRDKTGKDIFNKLYEEAGQRQANERQQLATKEHEMATIRLIKSQQQQHRMKQSILNGASHNLEPLYKRIKEVIDGQRLMRKKLATQLTENYPFRPIINDKSMCLKSGGWVERLWLDRKIREQKMSLLRENYQKEARKQLIFKPEINHIFINTESIEQHTVNRGIKIESCSPKFMPTINPISSLLINDRQNQSMSQQVDRLCYEPLKRKHDRVKLLAEEVYGQCKFQPEINPISRQIQSSGSRHKGHHCAQPIEEEHTFQPDINASSRLLSAAKRSKTEEKAKRQKEEQIQSWRRVEEYNELRECTFCPKVNIKKCDKNQGRLQNIVAGIPAFIRKIELTNSLKQMQLKLEEKLFRPQKKYDQRRSKKY